MADEAGRTVVLEWGDVEYQVRRLSERWAATGLTSVYGIPRGGTEVARLVSLALGVPVVNEQAIGDRTLVVDDLIDSGRTMQPFAERHFVDALYRKPHSPPYAVHAPCIAGWLVFPWEVERGETGPEDAVVRILEYIGEDPTREGLAATPRRVLSALTEMTEGLRQDPADVLSADFDGGSYDEMIVLRGIEFTSLCEHHLLPFTGTATVGYIPGKRVVGISKLARLVDVFARRPQIQERMTQGIAQAIEVHLGTGDVAVTVRATHHCMACRGVRKTPAMVTSTMLGAFRDKPEARAEFLSLAE